LFSASADDGTSSDDDEDEEVTSFCWSNGVAAIWVVNEFLNLDEAVDGETVDNDGGIILRPCAITSCDGSPTDPAEDSPAVFPLKDG